MNLDTYMQASGMACIDSSGPKHRSTGLVETLRLLLLAVLLLFKVMGVANAGNPCHDSPEQMSQRTLHCPPHAAHGTAVFFCMHQVSSETELLRSQEKWMSVSKGVKAG